MKRWDSEFLVTDPCQILRLHNRFYSAYRPNLEILHQ